ncbi:hypothetical protein CO670_15045 [Rhizobium sp. J15]|uniref:hypothetical protein n=1 Tax=Rhizobium sp. J15 TaxID=2035450 RepID=UPI000BE8F689|nr:hypothetical protein [Rhizobium sp. J15]PDT16095.1 hypothetical protein CO670_15045 [Rhizobium sp. J15]
MARNWRWDPCVSHDGGEAEAFVADYFALNKRKTLLIAGAGFDPRATQVADQLIAAGADVRGLFVREQRPNPVPELTRRAEANMERLQAGVPVSEIVAIDIFGPDGAVIGGRNVAMAASRQDIVDITDVIVDISALSVGTAFPLIRFFVERIDRGKGPPNLHLFVAHDPNLDSQISSVASDAPGYVHGFKGGLTLDAASKAAKLWLPQLAKGRQQALSRVHDFVAPHDTCPILPFPARDPRLGDHLAEEYIVEFDSAWKVDARDVVYADEQDPLHLYRTILGLDDLRKPVFRGAGGSILILSPLGTKVMSLGALMAALERDLPVAYLESIGYNFIPSVDLASSAPHLIHVWLEGDVYPQPRPRLKKGLIQ